MSQVTSGNLGLQSVIQASDSANKTDDHQRAAHFLETTLFPYFGEMFLKTNIFIGFYYIMGIFAGIQNITIGMMFNSPVIWDEIPYYFQYLNALVDWKITRNKFEDVRPQLIFGALLFLLIMVSYITVFINYYFTRNFFRWHLAWTRFISIILSTILVPIYSTIAGYLVLSVNEEPTGEKIAALAFYVMMMILILVIFFISITLNDYSVLFTMSPMGCWEYRVHIIMGVSISGSAFFQQVFSLLAEWMTLLLAITHIIAYCYVVYFLNFTPQHHFIMNTVLAGTAFLSLSCMTGAIVYFFLVRLNPILSLVIPIAAGIFVTCIFHVFTIFRRNKILRVLNNNTGTTLDISSKSDIFDTIEFSSTNDALSYIRIGLIYHCDFAADFSFFKYMLDNYANKAIICAIAQIAGICPDELQFLSYCISVLSKQLNFNIGEQFVIYQLRRIHILRQSSVSSDAVKTLATLKKMSDESISLVRSFWVEIEHAKTDISFTSLFFLRSKTVKTETAFKDAIDQYPNNALIYNEYLRFQLECQGEFKSACITAKKLNRLDQGKTLVEDYAFICFVNMFPSYILDHVLDVHGCRISKDSGLESQSTSTSYNLSSSSDDIMDLEQNDEMIHDYFNHPKLRLAIQKKLEHIYFPSYMGTILYGLFQFFVLFLLSVASMIILPKISKESNVYYDLFYTFSKLGAAFQYTTIDISMIFVPFTGNITGDNRFANLNEQVLQELNINASDIPPTPSFFVKPQVSLNNYAIELRKYFDDIEDFLNNELFYEEKEIFHEYKTKRYEVLMGTNMSTMTPYLYNITSHNYSIQSYFTELMDISISYNQIYESALGILASLPNNPLLIMDFYKYYAIPSLEVIMNSVDISNAIIKFEKQLEKDAIGFINQKRVFMLGSIYAIAVIFFLIIITTNSFNIKLLHDDFKRISKCLRSVPKKDIDESLRPVSVRTKETNMKGNIVHGAFDPNFNLYLYLLATNGTLIIVTIMLVTGTINYLNKMEEEGHVFEWFSENSIRYISSVNAIPLYFLTQTHLWDVEASNNIFEAYITQGYDANYKLKQSILKGDKKFQLFFFGSDDIEYCVNDNENYAMNAKKMSINARFDTILTLLKGTQETQDLAYRLHAVCEIFFLFSTYAYTDFYDILDHIMNVAMSFYKYSTQILFIMVVCTIVIAFIGLSLEIYIVHTLNMSIHIIAQLFSMLPPLTVVESSYFWDLIRERKNNESDYTMTHAQMILTRSTNACLMMDKNMIIQSVNRSLTTITGFTPDQILGQSISFLVPPTSMFMSIGEDWTPTEQFLSIIEDMRGRNGSDITTVKIKLLTENGSTIIVKATILCIRTSSKDIDAFAMIFRDMSQENAQKKKIMATKARVDSLLTGLVPPQVIEQVRNQKELQLFYSKTATVIFVNLSGLMQYVHTMSPNQMMDCLETIYTKFGDLCSSYPSIHELSATDDVFAAVSGLFDFHEEPKVQAEQVIQFAFSLIQMIEEINVQLMIHIELNIGVNQGMLVGSILNKSTPSFEMLGDVIGPAIQMQNDCSLNCVHITQSVEKHLDKKKYQFSAGPVLYKGEERAEKTFIITSPAE